MLKIATFGGYDYYKAEQRTGKKKGERYYNIVPTGSPAPKGGYYSHEFICKVKNVPNLFL